MSKLSRRPARELYKARLKEQKKLRQSKCAKGLIPSSQASIPNRKSELSTVAEEQAMRQDVLMEHTRVIRAQLPTLLKRLSKIPDPRNPGKIHHKLTSVMIFGILTFVFQFASRREANRRMTLPVFMTNLNTLFPELEDLPHHDTLCRLLGRIDVSEIEAVHLDLVRRLIRQKKFCHYLLEKCYPIAIDGTQKFARGLPWSDEALQRSVVQGEEKKTQYYVYVLEASFAFHNGMVLPLMSEFLSFSEGDLASSPQDCEQQAFRRLAKRLKREFPHLRILLLLDGLYPSGPVMEICRRYHWRFMIVLKDQSLPSVWAETRGLRRLQRENRWGQVWGDRQQRFWWVNEIEYCYGANERRRLTLHVVVCEESWQDVDAQGEVQTHNSRHAWVSSQPLSRITLHERCNLGARHRWGIESNILVEKHQGYHYEHCFAYNWTAMKGYHYLMRLGHFFNVLARYCEHLLPRVQAWGVRGLIDLLRETVAGPWLVPDQVRARLEPPFQIRLAW